MSTSSQDRPEFAHAEQHLVPRNDYPSAVQPIPQSKMFVVKASLAEYVRREGPDAPMFDVSQGDGGASLPGVPPALLQEALRIQLTRGSRYSPPSGTPRFCRVTAEQYWKIAPDTGWGPDNIILTVGGRDALAKAYSAMIHLGHGAVGDALIVSKVPWISYTWGPYGMGLNVLRAPGRAEDAWRYTPEAIRESVAHAQQMGRKIAGIVITSPDNPTGRTYTIAEQISLAHAALEAGCAYVLFDWIYHWVSDTPHDINEVLRAFSPADRQRLIFLDGLTKSLGASNIRSAHLVASRDVIAHVRSRASHEVIPSFFAEAVAIAAYEQGYASACAGIVGPTRKSKEVLRKELIDRGMRFVMGDGYYAFIDVGDLLDRTGIRDTADLGSILARQYGLVIVPGAYFSPAGSRWIRFSYALPPEVTTQAVQRMFAVFDNLPDRT